MKKTIIALAAMAISFSAYAKDLQELVFTTNPPMSCQNCENKIKNNLRFEKGIKNIQTNIPDQRVTIVFDADKTDADKIENAFSKIGYQATVIQPENVVRPENIINPENQCSAPAENCE